MLPLFYLIKNLKNENKILNLWFKLKFESDWFKFLKLNKRNFSKFIEKLFNEIKSNSQQTLWGNSPKPITKNTHRVTRFLSDFGRLGAATIQFEEKEIKLDNNNIVISSK